jgi:hypothetical protein
VGKTLQEGVGLPAYKAGLTFSVIKMSTANTSGAPILNRFTNATIEAAHCLTHKQGTTHAPSDSHGLQR